MGEIFIKILDMSIVTSLLILIVVILRSIFKACPKWIRCILWGLVALRLVFPISIESKFSLVPNAQKLDKSISTSTSYSDLMELSGKSTNVETMQDTLLTIMSVVWIVGVILMLGYMAWSYLKIYIKIREKVNYRDNIWLCDHISSPFVLGFFKPKIFLFSGLTEKESEYVIAHEQAHIKRLDNFFKPLGFILLSIYWVNPFCWLAYILFVRDIELACDEKVIKTLDKTGRSAYSKALLACSLNSYGINACPLAFGADNVKHRIKSILKYKRNRINVTIFALIACLSVVALFMTNPVSISADENVSQNSTKAKKTLETVQTETEETSEVKNQKTQKPSDSVKPKNHNVATEVETTAPSEIASEKQWSDNEVDNVQEFENNYVDFSLDYNNYANRQFAEQNRAMFQGGYENSSQESYEPIEQSEELEQFNNEMNEYIINSN